MTAALFPARTRSVAVFSDVHGNIRALEAVLTDIAEQDVDAVACNGDLITSSAHAEAVVRRIRELGIPTTRGNHERYLAELADPQDEKWRQANWAPTHHDFRTLSVADRQWLCDLPHLLWLCDGAAPLIMAHAAPGDDTGRLDANVSDEVWRRVFATFPSGSTLVGSHLHWFWQRRWQDHQFVRTPAAGLPLDGDHRAGYCILRREDSGWSVEQRRVGYDLEAELASFRDSDYYHQGGIISRLFWEELHTARSWLLPFFAHIRQGSPAASLNPNATGYDRVQLEMAWETFDRDRFPQYEPDAPGGIS